MNFARRIIATISLIAVLNGCSIIFVDSIPTRSESATFSQAQKAIINDKCYHAQKSVAPWADAVLSSIAFGLGIYFYATMNDGSQDCRDNAGSHDMCGNSITHKPGAILGALGGILHASSSVWGFQQQQDCEE